MVGEPLISVLDQHKGKEYTRSGHDTYISHEAH